MSRRGDGRCSLVGGLGLLLLLLMGESERRCGGAGRCGLGRRGFSCVVLLSYDCSLCLLSRRLDLVLLELDLAMTRRGV